MSDTKLFVCVACRNGDDADARPGAALYEALCARAQARGVAMAIAPVDCLAVCKRPTTVALTAAGKWTYVVGDIDAGAHLDDVIDMAQSFAASENGIVAWKERPACFRKGVVSRTPPLNA